MPLSYSSHSKRMGYARVGHSLVAHDVAPFIISLVVIRKSVIPTMYANIAQSACSSVWFTRTDTTRL